MYKNVQIIAEVKTQSPFGYRSEKTWDELFAVANEIGDMISIHTDSRWGGSFDLIRKAKILTSKLILAKGIHANDEDIQNALDAGADWVLVVGRIPKVHIEKCLIEPLTLNELKNVPEGLRVVWNTRDLSNELAKIESFEDARSLRRGWMCQASNIKTVDDIQTGADAILVGTHLLDFSKFILK